MFDKFVQDIKKMPVVPPVLLDMDISNDPRYNLDQFKMKVLHNADIPDDELYTFLKTQYREILRSIFGMTDPAYIKFFTTHKFIMTLNTVMSQINIDDEIRIYCNKLAYDYITYDGMQKDIGELMIGLTKTVNSEMILLLKGLGLRDDHAVYIAMAGKSSETNTINIRRVNFILATSVSERWENLDDEEALAEAEQLIVNIYQRVFRGMNITNLFEANMMDTYDQNAPWMNDRIATMYSLTSTAVLHILNKFEMVDIRKVLMNYAFDYSVLSQNGKHSRFSLHNLSGDFYRINTAIDALKAEGIYVP